MRDSKRIYAEILQWFYNYFVEHLRFEVSSKTIVRFVIYILKHINFPKYIKIGFLWKQKQGWSQITKLFFQKWFLKRKVKCQFSTNRISRQCWKNFATNGWKIQKIWICFCFIHSHICMKNFSNYNQFNIFQVEFMLSHLKKP